MVRYILKPVKKMYDCNICFSQFKNGGSLASHKYKFHKDQSSNPDQSSDERSEEEIPKRNMKGGSLKRKRDYLSDEDIAEEYDSDGSIVSNRVEKPLQISKPMVEKPKRTKQDIMDSDDADDDESSDDADDDKESSDDADDNKESSDDTEDESVDKSKEKPFNLLSAYEAKHNYFTLLVDKETAPDLKIVGDEKLLIDAVISTQSLEEVMKLLNENISIYHKICVRVKFYMDNKEDK